MLDYLKEETNRTTTENDCVSFVSTQSKVLDFFFSAGASRDKKEKEIETNFSLAFNEDPLLALKCLFFVRDVRKGLGERKTFRTALSWLSRYNHEALRKNINLIPEFGRYDDLLTLLNTSLEKDVAQLIFQQMKDDLIAIDSKESVSLLGKWLPSENTSSEKTRKQARHLMKLLKIPPQVYRRSLVKMRKAISIIENNLRERDYTFEYSKVPSKAMLKYRKAFERNDYDRYSDFLGRVEKGEEKINTSTLNACDIIAKCYDEYSVSSDIRNNQEERRTLNTLWNNLEDTTGDEDAIVVADGSGSMYGYGQKPICVAHSLAIYFAERNKGKFKNHFITFSEKPKLVEIPENLDIYDKVSYVSEFDDISNTNIIATFKLILDVATKYRLKQKDLPKRMYIISDMQFDEVTDEQKTAFEKAKEMFNHAGYELPQIIFWNVADRSGNIPITMNEQGVALVSGYTQKLFELVKSDDLSPYKLMLDILNSDRYREVTI